MGIPLPFRVVSARGGASLFGRLPTCQTDDRSRGPVPTVTPVVREGDRP
jgi:hypothetical protein